MTIFYLILIDITVPIMLGYFITSLLAVNYMNTYIIYSSIIVIFSFINGFYENYYSKHFSEKIRISFITGSMLIFFQLTYYSYYGINMNIIIILSWILIPIIILLIRYFLMIENKSKNNSTISIIGNLYKFKDHEIKILTNKQFKVNFYNELSQYLNRTDINLKVSDIAVINMNTPITQVVNEGQLSIIKPNVAHTMVFTKDTTFLNLVRGERDHENYGISHTIRHWFVDEAERDLLMSSYKFDCRSCGNDKLKRVVSLGYQPLANNLINKKNEKCELYPLELNYCDNCHNCQLSVAVDPKKMFSNYLYTSSTSEVFRNHFIEASKKYIKSFNLKPKKSYIIDIGSNDGVALKPFKELGYKNILGVEPAKNLAKLANQNKIKTFNGFLDKKNIKKIKKNADLILASNVFAHSDNLKEMTECMIQLLSKNGVIIIEVQYLLDTLKDLTFDNIYHEHYNYWSLTSLINFLKQFKIKIFKVEKIPTHGGSIRVYIKKGNNIKIEKNVKEMIKDEEDFGIKDFKTYQKFGENVYKIRKNVIKNLDNLKKNGKKIIGYGAPAKATTALNFFGVRDQIDFIVEDNKLKHNKFIPGVNIPIYSKKKIRDKKNLILVLAWNFFDDIKKNNNHISNNFINIKSLEK